MMHPGDTEHPLYTRARERMWERRIQCGPLPRPRNIIHIDERGHVLTGWASASKTKQARLYRTRVRLFQQRR